MRLFLKILQLSFEVSVYIVEKTTGVLIIIFCVCKTHESDWWIDALKFLIIQHCSIPNGLSCSICTDHFHNMPQ